MSTKKCWVCKEGFERTLRCNHCENDFCFSCLGKDDCEKKASSVLIPLDGNIEEEEHIINEKNEEEIGNLHIKRRKNEHVNMIEEQKLIKEIEELKKQTINILEKNKKISEEIESINKRTSQVRRDCERMNQNFRTEKKDLEGKISEKRDFLRKVERREEELTQVNCEWDDRGYLGSFLRGGEGVKRNPLEHTLMTLQHSNEELRNDKVFVLEEVKKDGLSLKYASEELRNDKLIVLEAVKQHRLSLQYASEKLKNDREVVLEAVKKDGRSLQYASKKLRNEKEIVLEAVKLHRWSLFYAGEKLKNDKEFILDQVRKDGRSLQYASEELKNDKEVVLEAVKLRGYSLRHASKRLKNDKEVVLEAVKKDGDSLQFASKEMTNDKEVVFEAVKQYWSALHFGSEELKNDKEFIREVVKINGFSLRFASEKVINDLQFWFHEKEDWQNGNRNIQSPFFKKKSKKLDTAYCLRFFCSRKSFKDLVFGEFINRGAYGGAYRCHFDVPFVPLVIKIYNDAFIDETKKEELLQKDSMKGVMDGPFYNQHDNVVTILKYSDKETLDLRKLSDYDEYWKSMFFGKEKIKRCGMILMRFYETTLKKYLHSRGNSLEIIEIRHMIWGLLLGICHMHNNMFVHRDLHAENVFVEPSEGRILIGDFGCSLNLRSNKKRFIVHKDNDIMFSFTNNSYLGREDDGILGKKILEHLRKGEDDLGISEFLDKMTVEDPKNRLGFEEVLEVGSFIEVKESEESCHEENGEFEDSDEE